MVAEAKRALSLFALLAVATCGGDEPETCCPTGVTSRCAWNPETMQFDRDCTYACAFLASDGDAGGYGGRGRNTIGGPYSSPPPMCRDR